MVFLHFIFIAVTDMIDKKYCLSKFHFSFDDENLVYILSLLGIMPAYKIDTLIITQPHNAPNGSFGCAWETGGLGWAMPTGAIPGLVAPPYMGCPMPTAIWGTDVICMPVIGVI